MSVATQLNALSLLAAPGLTGVSGGWFLAAFEPAVAAYGLRLCRNLGTRRVGWWVFTAFMLLALAHLVCGADFGGVSTHSGGNWALVAVPFLLLIGMAHTESHLVCSLRAEEKEHAARRESEANVEARINELKKEQSKLLAELAWYKENQEALLESQRETQLLFTENPQPMWICDLLNLRFVAANNAALALYGFGSEEFLSRSATDMVPADLAVAFKQDLATPAKTPECRGVWRHARKDGTLVEVEVKAVDLKYGERAARLVVATDLGEQRSQEAALREADKMELVARFSGTAAFQLERVLSGIQCEAEGIAGEPLEPAAEGALRRICLSAERGAAMTRALFMAGKSFPAELTPVNLNGLLLEQESRLRRGVGSEIKFEASYQPDLPAVMADSRLLEHIILNLVRNAAEAMAGRGTITIKTEAVALPGNAESGAQDSQSVFACLSIRDTGRGISPETQKRLFEPFIAEPGTNKLGLGLASTFGAVQQLSGRIEFTSEPGATEFRVYFPCCGLVTAEEEPQAAPSGGGTVLLVQADVRLRTLARAVLDWHGYHVIETDSPAVAFLLWERQASGVDLVVTDVAFPGGASGQEFIAVLRERKPDVRVLYTRDASGDGGEGGSETLIKPYTSGELLECVSGCLQAGREG